MTPVQTELFGATRATDPESSRDAARRAPVVSQRATVLRLLSSSERAAGGRVWRDADWFADVDPHGSHRSIWSARLSGMVRARLLDVDRDAKPIKVALTDKGRAEARRLGVAS